MFDRFFINGEYSNIIDILTTGRLDKWKIYITPWKNSLRTIFFGVGLSFDYGTVFSSHSLYLGYLSRLGICGLLMITLFVYVCIFKDHHQNKLNYLPILIVLLICMVEDMSYNTINFIPFIMSAILTIPSFKSN